MIRSLKGNTCVNISWLYLCPVRAGLVAQCMIVTMARGSASQHRSLDKYHSGFYATASMIPASTEAVSKLTEAKRCRSRFLPDRELP